MSPFHITESKVFKGSRDSLVRIATGYGLDDWGSIPGTGKIFFSSPKFPDQLWVLTSLVFKLVPSLGIQRPGREADLLPPSSAEVKNGAVPPLPCTSSWCGA
jgi:hypothetical protein